MIRSLTRTTYRLFAIVGAATTAAYFGLFFALLPLLSRPNLPRLVEVPVMAVAVLTPVAVASWWIFKKLRPNYSARTARKGAIAFGVFMPVSWGVAFPLSTLVGGYSEFWTGHSFFALVGADVYVDGIYVGKTCGGGANAGRPQGGGSKPTNAANTATISATTGVREAYCNKQSNIAMYNAILPGLGDSLFNYQNTDVAQELTSGVLESLFGFGTVAGQAMSATSKSDAALTSGRLLEFQRH